MRASAAPIIAATSTWVAKGLRFLEGAVEGQQDGDEQQGADHAAPTEQEIGGAVVLDSAEVLGGGLDGLHIG